jgi:excisionase family DNA binding protein
MRGRRRPCEYGGLMLDTEISLHEVADTLNVHYMTVYRYVRQGLLPARKVGRSWFVSAADLESFRNAKCEPEATSSPRPEPRNEAPWAQRLEARLTEGDERGALELMESVLRAGHDLLFLYTQVLSPAMVSIGARWAQGELGIYVEHRATNLALRLMSQVGSRFTRRGVSKGAVIFGAPKGEEHSLAVSIVADLVRSEGWDVHDLGGNMPAHAFAEAARLCNDVVAVCIGITMEHSIASGREVVAEVRKVLHPDVPIYVGGAAVRDAATVELLSADHWARDPQALIDSLNALARRR